jgi:hypothetical protein
MNKFIQDCFDGKETATSDEQRKIIIDFVNSQNKEVWLYIRDYENYLISNKGRVFSYIC